MVQATDIKARGSRQELPADDPEALNRPSARVGNSRRFGNTYDAARDSRTRKSTSRTLKAEDSVLDTSDRRKLTAEARDIVRNFPEAAWCARKHLDFVASRNFQARTADSGLNKAIEAHIAWRSQPENCDLAARHPLHRMRRLAEAHAIIDGDIVWLKLADGRCQAIEGDRIRAPEYGELPPRLRRERFHARHCHQPGRAGAGVLRMPPRHQHRRLPV